MIRKTIGVYVILQHRFIILPTKGVFSIRQPCRLARGPAQNAIKVIQTGTIQFILFLHTWFASNCYATLHYFTSYYIIVVTGQNLI